MKATEEYFSMVLFIMRYNVVLTFESVHEFSSVTIQMKTIELVLSCGTVYYAVQGGSNI